MRLLVALALTFGLAAQARAGDLEVMVATAAGTPVLDAVVMAVPDAGARAPRIAGPYVMAQKDTQFQPRLLVVPVGAEVSFPNLDPFRHHVYSFSRAKPFELKLYGKDETRSVRFDKAGVVAVGCNIHDQMSAWIRVVDTAWSGRTTLTGRAVLHDLPAGPATIIIWHPQFRAANGEMLQRVVVPASGQVRLAVSGDLKPVRLRREGY